MDQCPFCNLPSEKDRMLHEGDSALVIFSNPRLRPGHLLVLPKRHVEKPWEMNAEELRETQELVLDFQQRIIRNLAPGCDVRQNYRPFIIQNRLKIDHVHYHLIPREFEDDLYANSMIHEKQLFQTLTSQEVDLVSTKILSG